jgi:hypothetical protein
MSEERDMLERAAAKAPVPTFTVIDLRERGDRRRRLRRAGTLLVGSAVAACSILFAYMAIPGTNGAGPAAGTEALPPATSSPLVAGPGESYYWRVHLIGGCVEGSCLTAGVDYTELQATYWWSPDDSGRIEVETAHNYGIQAGTFQPGDFPNPNGIDVSSFPTDPSQLAAFLEARSQQDGASPVPVVTPPPAGAPNDGQMWRAITDLLQNPQVTPAVRAALLDVAAGLQGSHLDLNGTDPVGRPAYVISFGDWGGDQLEKLYVDPSTHELLAWTVSSASAANGTYVSDFVVDAAGIPGSIGEVPKVSSIPNPAQPLPSDVRSLAQGS